jgi:DNA modification methylase
MDVMVVNADARAIPLADKSVHTVVTSPPYWGLRDYGVEGQLGLEKTPEEYVEKLVQIFREVRRVLRDDGTCWVNLGDSYAGAGDRPNGKGNEHGQMKSWKTPDKVIGLKPKDLVGIPWRVAFALQADGWYFRSDIVWEKPNCMPESVRDRPTRSHEYLFLLTKSRKYYYDFEAIKEPAVNGDPAQPRESKGVRTTPNGGRRKQDAVGKRTYTGFNARWDDRPEPLTQRNRRSVWTITTTPFKGAHFATFPPSLVEPCIKAGTSEHGCCPICGASWERVTERAQFGKAPSATAYKDEAMKATRLSGSRQAYRAAGLEGPPPSVTTGFRPTCAHTADPIPCVVLDPFAGSGTTLAVARELGRSAIGLDLSYKYLHDIVPMRLNKGG